MQTPQKCELVSLGKVGFWTHKVLLLPDKCRYAEQINNTVYPISPSLPILLNSNSQNIIAGLIQIHERAIYTKLYAYKTQ